MAMHPEIAGMLHQFVAAMPEAQTMDASGQPMAGAPAAPVAPAPGAMQASQAEPAADPSAQLGSFQQTVGTAERALESARTGSRDTAASIIADTDQAIAFQAAADKEKTLVENAGAHKIATMYRNFMPKMDAMDKATDEAMAQAKVQSSKAYDTYLRAANDFSQTHIYNWWSKASTGAQILGVLSQIAAGAAQGLNGQIGAKTPLDHIIDRDLEEQKLNIAQKGEAVQNAKGVYNELRATLRDDVAAASAAREVAYSSIRIRAEAMAANTKDAGAKSRLMQVAATTKTHQANLRTEVKNQADDKALKASFAEVGAAGQFAGFYAAKDAQGGKESTIGLSDIDGDTEALAKQAPTVFADLQKKTAAGNNALSAMNSLRERLADPTIRKGESIVDFNAKNNAFLSTVMTNMNTLAALGALSEGDSQKLLQQAGLNTEFGLGSSAKTFLPGNSYESMAKRMGGSIRSLHGQMATSIGSIKVNGQALRFTRALPEGL